MHLCHNHTRFSNTFLLRLNSLPIFASPFNIHFASISNYCAALTRFRLWSRNIQSSARYMWEHSNTQMTCVCYSLLKSMFVAKALRYLFSLLVSVTLKILLWMKEDICKAKKILLFPLMLIQNFFVCCPLVPCFCFQFLPSL